jgi:hypothetical protein
MDENPELMKSYRELRETESSRISLNQLRSTYEGAK